MKPEKESKKEAFKEIHDNWLNKSKQIRKYINKHGVLPNMETLWQITGNTEYGLKSMIEQIDLYGKIMQDLGFPISRSEFSLFYLRANKNHKTYFLYDEERKKYLPMRILDVIYNETDKDQYSSERWVLKYVIQVKYPENGWSVLIVPDNEIYKYFYGRVAVDFVDLPKEVFDTLEDAIEAIKEWKAYSVRVTDTPNVWSGFDVYSLGTKGTDITEEVSITLPDQIVNRESISKNKIDQKESLDNKKCMDEVIFAKVQQEKCGFTGLGITNKDYINLNKKIDQIGIEKLNTSEKIKLAFIMTFGAHGSRIDLDKALLIVENLYNIERIITPFEDVNDEYMYPECYCTDDNLVGDNVYISWLKNIGHISVLLGTIYAYKKETIKSCYFFLQALKTENLVLSEIYYDFMNYMFSKLSDLPMTNYFEDPMENLISSDPHSVKLELQNRIISDLVNEDEDMIVAHYRNGQIYGHINHTEDDACESWIITSKFELKRFNFKLHQPFDIPVTDMEFNFKAMTVLIPRTFRIKRNSSLINRNLFFSYQFGYPSFGSNFNDSTDLYSRVSAEIIHNNIHPIY